MGFLVAVTHCKSLDLQNHTLVPCFYGQQLEQFFFLNWKTQKRVQYIYHNKQSCDKAYKKMVATKSEVTWYGSNEWVPYDVSKGLVFSAWTG